MAAGDVEQITDVSGDLVRKWAPVAIEKVTTTSNDTTKVLRPNGSGGIEAAAPAAAPLVWEDIF